MKTFETEYKNQIAIEVPDLWDRIEAGVDAYESAKNETVTAKADENIENKITAISRKRTFVTIAKVVGAAACLLLVINVFRIVGTSKDAAPAADATYFNAAADCATAKEAEPAMAEEACESEEAWSDDSTIDAYISNNKGESTGAAYEEAATETEEAVSADVTETVGVDAAEETDDKEYLSAENYDIDSVLNNGTVLYVSGHWLTGVEDKRTEREYDDLTIIGDLFECNDESAKKIQDILREGNIAGVEYGFYKALSPEVENYMMNDSQFLGVDKERVSITVIETVDNAQYIVFTVPDNEIQILEIVKTN